MSSTRSPRMHTNHSCRFTVGSQWPGMSLSFCPSVTVAGPSSSMMPFSPDAPVWRAPGTLTTRGIPASILCALRPASTTAGDDVVVTLEHHEAVLPLQLRERLGHPQRVQGRDRLVSATVHDEDRFADLLEPPQSGPWLQDLVLPGRVIRPNGRSTLALRVDGLQVLADVGNAAVRRGCLEVPVLVKGKVGHPCASSRHATRPVSYTHLTLPTIY